MEKDIQIALLDKHETDEVIDFFNLTYNENRSKAKFLWEFDAPPAGKAIYVIAKDKLTKKIIGTQCAIPIDIITGKGELIRTAKSEDTLLNPEYRGMKLFDKMYQLLFEECRKQKIKFIWGFTPAKKPFKQLGFEIPFDQGQSLLVKSIFSAYSYLSKLNSNNTRISLLKIFALCVVSKIKSYKDFFISNSQIDSKYSIQVTDKNEIYDNNSFIHKVFENDNDGFTINQDIPFLTWRIKNNPYYGKVYSIYFSDKSEVVSTIVFNHHKDGIWYIVYDLYAKKLTVDEKTKMLSKAIKKLIEKEKGNVKLIRTWDFDTNRYNKSAIEIRLKMGFIYLNKGISFVWKSLDDGQPLNPNNFLLSRLASQGVV